MELKREHWSKSDAVEFQEYLNSFSKGKEKGEWEKRIINTNLDCIAVPSPEVKRIINEISKGNFLEFIDLWLWENFTNTSINGGLICKIKDFDLMTKYLDKYAEKCDNWASTDSLKFKIKPENMENYYKLAKKYTENDKPFVRRIGFIILFKLISSEYIDKIFEIMNNFYNEDHYYVNMVNAWLFAECFTKQREKTLEFLKTHKLNKFTINKGISKCRDSFRISPEDKEMLLLFKVK